MPQQEDVFHFTIYSWLNTNHICKIAWLVKLFHRDNKKRVSLPATLLRTELSMQTILKKLTSGFIAIRFLPLKQFQ